jgi:hypothetical protein
MKYALICNLSSFKTAVFDSAKPQNLGVWRDNLYLREARFSFAKSLQCRAGTAASLGALNLRFPFLKI